MEKVLVIGFYVPHTGFSKVIKYCLYDITKSYEVHYLGEGYQGPVCVKDSVKLYPNISGMCDYFNFSKIKELLSEIKPSIVFIVHDIRYQQQYVQLLESLENRQRFKIVTYIPLEGDVYPNLLSYLKYVDKAICYTAFAKRMIESKLNSFLNNDQTINKPIEIIPHGIDESIFYPYTGSIALQLEKKARLNFKKEIFPDEENLENSFIVLNANRIDPRKAVGLTIEAFAIFAKDKPQDVKLCIHEPDGHPEDKQNILELADSLGIRQKILMGSTGAISEKKLSLLYNACEVGMTTSMGEGWGLTNFEHAATGAAQIIPSHTALKEIWEGAAEMLNPKDKFFSYFSPFEMQMISPKDAADAMDRLYKDRDYLNQMSIKAYKRVTQPQYMWSNIAKRWAEVFQEVLRS